MKEIKRKMVDFIDDHPYIASIIGAILVYLAVVAALGLIVFILWLDSISKIASAAVILFPLLVIYIKCVIDP